MVNVTVTCSACAHRFDATAPTSVCLPQDVAVEAALRDGAILRRPCPACGAPVELEPPALVVSDLVRSWYIVALPRAREPEATELERAIEQRFLSDLDGDRGIWGDGTMVRRRVVFGSGALREKLLCWHHGIDDAVLEALKLAMLATPRAREIGLRRLRMTRCEGERLLFDSNDPNVPIDVDRAAVRMLTTQRAAIAARWPELFRDGWVDAARLLGR